MGAHGIPSREEAPNPRMKQILVRHKVRSRQITMVSLGAVVLSIPRENRGRRKPIFEPQLHIPRIQLMPNMGWAW